MPFRFGCTWLEEKAKGWISPGEQPSRHLAIGVTELDGNEHCSHPREVHLEFCLSNTTCVPLSTGDRPTGLRISFGGFVAYPRISAHPPGPLSPTSLC